MLRLLMVNGNHLNHNLFSLTGDHKSQTGERKRQPHLRLTVSTVLVSTKVLLSTVSGSTTVLLSV